MFFSSVSFLFRPESLLGLIFPTAGKNDLILILKRRNIPPQKCFACGAESWGRQLKNHGVVMGSSHERADDPDDPKKKNTGKSRWQVFGSIGEGISSKEIGFRVDFGGDLEVFCLAFLSF